MLTLKIPAKTFLLGEYAAVAEQGAMIITTEPCFEVTRTDTPGLVGIHPDSPAGRFWKTNASPNHGLRFEDPYHQLGGMGASSAQFLGAYRFSHAPQTEEGLLAAYWQFAWQGQGLRPSGYDVLAQTHAGCVYIHRQTKRVEIFEWPFPSLALIIARTQNKLATHQHLAEKVNGPLDVLTLNALVEKAVQAYRLSEEHTLIKAVNNYHLALLSMDLVAVQTQQLIKTLKNTPELLAIKGCGAMGADVLLCITTRVHQPLIEKRLASLGLTLLATHAQLTSPTAN
jgi:mevalonate kinase